MTAYGDQPFGLRDIKIVPATGGAIDLPAAQTLKLTPRIKGGELPGDDMVKAVAAYIEAYEWDLEAGGISLEAHAALTGQTMTTSGTTPTAYKTLKHSAGNEMPYVKLYGKALGVGTDDIHAKLYKAKCTKMEGSLKGGEFYVTAASGVAVDDGLGNGIVDWVQHETAADLPAA